MTAWICLRATLWRHSAYPWNGSISYLPCATEIKIKNDGSEKSLLITMFSMEYYGVLFRIQGNMGRTIYEN
jgi:hypothetical protein